MRLRVRLCLLVIEPSYDHLGLQLLFSYMAGWLARCVRSNLFNRVSCFAFSCLSEVLFGSESWKSGG